jgi:hypothetical protein
MIHIQFQDWVSAGRFDSETALGRLPDSQTADIETFRHFPQMFKRAG